MDAYDLSDASLPEPTTVYRGMRGKHWRTMLKGVKPGAVFQDNNLMAADSAPVLGVDIMMEIHAPAGAHLELWSRTSTSSRPDAKLKLASYDGRHKAVFEMMK